MTQLIVVDFGSQFTQLIARRVRELGVYCEIVPYTITAEEVKLLQPKGIILSGSPDSVTQSHSPRADAALYTLGIPILGLCYGMQVMAVQLEGAGEVKLCGHKEFGQGELFCDLKGSPIFGQLRSSDGEARDAAASPPPPSFNDMLRVLMSHGDQVVALPHGFDVIASTTRCPIAAMADHKRSFYGLQFHPETEDTLQGRAILGSFVLDISKCQIDWTIENVKKTLIEDIKRKVEKEAAGGDVLLALSGGVDSSVVACLLHEALGDRVHCVMVDNGLLRKEEGLRVLAAFMKHHSTFKLDLVDASALFYERLAGVTDPETKRKIIGNLFIEVFDAEVKRKYPNVTMLAQGTIYPDVIESAKVGTAALIKTHHNVGGLPEKMKLKLLEPVRALFKDEVRKVGELMGLPHDFVWRHPFPGPGLGVRIVGEVTQERADKLRLADDIFIEELHNHKIYYECSQAFAVLLPCKSVAVKGDARTYEEVLVLRAISTVDFMTARVSDVPPSFLRHVAQRITNEVHGISRVCFDYTDKPPGTIEWE